MCFSAHSCHWASHSCMLQQLSCILNAPPVCLSHAFCAAIYPWMLNQRSVLGPITCVSLPAHATEHSHFQTTSGGMTRAPSGLCSLMHIQTPLFQHPQSWKQRKACSVSSKILRILQKKDMRLNMQAFGLAPGLCCFGLHWKSEQVFFFVVRAPYLPWVAALSLSRSHESTGPYIV